MSSSIKQQVIEDLQMAGLSPHTQKAYLANIVRFVKRTGTRPQDAREDQVAAYLRGLVVNGKCRGTIKPNVAALQFVFQNTLGRDWGLFKKGLPLCVGIVCPTRRAIPSVAG